MPWYFIPRSEMSETTRSEGRDRAADHDPAVDVEAYEVDDGVVLFDAQNPLAWVEASVAVRLADAA
jgi:hypothetical protein